MLDINITACPFCGNTEISEFSYVKTDSAHGYFLWHVCCSCGATGPDGETQTRAIDVWNSRRTK